MAVCLICHGVPKKDATKVHKERDFVCSKCVLWLVENPRSHGERFEDVAERIRGGQLNEGKEIEGKEDSKEEENNK